MGVKLGALDISKFYVGSQEVDKIYLGTNMVYQKIQYPPVPYTEWSGNASKSVGGTLPISPYLEMYGQVGTTTVEITAPDFGVIQCIKQPEGFYNGIIYPMGTPSNGDYFVSYEIAFTVTGYTFTITKSAFKEGIYPDLYYPDDNFPLWITKIEVIQW